MRGSRLQVNQGRQELDQRVQGKGKLVIDGMMGHACSALPPVDVPMSAISVKSLVTEASNAKTMTRNLEDGEPAFKCLNYFGPTIFPSSMSTDTFSPTARHTTTDHPLLQPLLNEFLDIAAMTTIHSNPLLFPVRIPTNIDWFEQLLSTHPNLKFTESVCVATRRVLALGGHSS
jgi:hypothetical protein